ncbi:hypothetical protein N7540_006408 [Penicillium herquei]|nr:hypothetical protein N7540_006408 [Penicillium herquei]
MVQSLYLDLVVPAISLSLLQVIATHLGCFAPGLSRQLVHGTWTVSTKTNHKDLAALPTPDHRSQTAKAAGCDRGGFH